MQLLIKLFGVVFGAVCFASARACPGQPCADPNDPTTCRSEFGFCGVGAAWCNERSTWNSTGCLLLPDNGCAGVPCQDTTQCRSAANSCGSGSDFCNSQSLFQPGGCPGGPTSGPTVSPIKAPTFAPVSSAPVSKAPSSRSPTTASPTSSAPSFPGATPAPSFPAATLAPVPLQSTLSPTDLSTSIPTSSPVGVIAAGSSNQISMQIGIGSGIGVLAIAGLAVVAVRRRRKSRLSKALQETWTPEEEDKLRVAFQTTHDFDALCKVVPGRSRESVAARTRMMIQPRRTIFHSWIIKPIEGYAFLAERTRNMVPSSKRFMPSQFSSKRLQTQASTSHESFVNMNGTLVYSGPKSTKTPSAFITRVSDNPLYFQDY